MVNLGTEEEVKVVRIGATVQEDVKEKLVKLLQEYMDVFAWCYEDMSSIETEIVVHRLPLKVD